MNFVKIEDFYRNVYSRPIGDEIIHDNDISTTISLPFHNEWIRSITDFLLHLNSPPDTLMKIRATAFKVASQQLLLQQQQQQQQQDEEEEEEEEEDVEQKLRLLLRQLYGIITTIHTTCYTTSSRNSNSTSSTTVNAESDGLENEVKIRTYFHQLLDEMNVDGEENEQLVSFLQQLQQSQSPPIGFTTTKRLVALVMMVGYDHFHNNNNNGSHNNNNNEQIFRCMNVIIHAIETVFYQPKPYHLQLSSSSSSSSSTTTTTTSSNNNTSYSAMAAIASGGKGAATLYEENTGTTVSNVCNNNNDVDFTSMTLNEAVQQLWNYDMNRLTFNDDIQINVQQGKKPYIKQDMANDTLFTHVHPNVLRRSTYAAFIQLLDNYHSMTSITEEITTIERHEIYHFLSIIMETAPMQFCYQYCKTHDVLSNRHGNNNNNNNDNNNDDGTSSSIQEFKDLLYTIWFEPYSRDGTRDSSGFEHVFIGEVQENAISGFHNWIQFYHQEQLGNIDYRGYIKPRSSSSSNKESSCNTHDHSDDHLLTLQFAWKHRDTYVEKFVGTMFIGVSPEFEMALYTMCFLFGKEENDITLDTGVDIYDIVIKCYTMARGKIGTTFPEVKSHYDDNDD